MPAALDLPADNTLSDPLGVQVRGWFYGEQRHGELAAIEIAADTGTLGRTELLYCRRDVCAALGIEDNLRTGFSLIVDASALLGRASARLEVLAVWRDGSRTPILSREVRLGTTDHRRGDWGLLVDRSFTHLVRREHMFNSGPSQEAASAELLTLLERYLPPAPARVLDVGCGRGPYAAPLRTRGYDWFGAEVKAEDCAHLAQQGLPHVQVDGTHLPFAAGAFEAAIAVEVLEHVVDPWSFVADVRRVVRSRFIVSVPNVELVTYWRPHLAIPWHMLDADHRNFFSRASLHELLRTQFRSVEVLSYGEAPLKTAEGAGLDYHLLAIASA